MEKTIVDLAREIQAISQSGLSFSKDPFDHERFTQLLAVASDLIARHTKHPKEYIDSVFSAEKGYITPKLDVRAAAFRESKILLVKERGSEGWTLPGGFVDVNESLSEATIREAQEESGFTVRPLKIAAVFDHRKHGYKPHLYHFYKIYILCDIDAGDLKSSSETEEVAFFARAEINPLEVDMGRCTREHILRMFDHHENVHLPADFD